MEGKPLEVHLVDFLDVLAVVLAQDDFPDACTLGSEDFLLDATHGQYLAAQGDFAGHRQVVLDTSLGKRGCQGGYHCHTSRWAVFGNGTLRHMDMHIVFIEQVGVNIE